MQIIKHCHPCVLTRPVGMPRGHSSSTNARFSRFSRTTNPPCTQNFDVSMTTIHRHTHNAGPSHVTMLIQYTGGHQSCLCYINCAICHSCSLWTATAAAAAQLWHENVTESCSVAPSSSLNSYPDRPEILPELKSGQTRMLSREAVNAFTNAPLIYVRDLTLIAYCSSLRAVFAWETHTEIKLLWWHSLVA